MCEHLFAAWIKVSFPCFRSIVTFQADVQTWPASRQCMHSHPAHFLLPIDVDEVLVKQYAPKTYKMGIILDCESFKAAVAEIKGKNEEQVNNR